MANQLYPKIKEALLLQSVNSNWSAGTVKAALIDTGTYTYSAAHEFLSSLTGIVGTPQTIGAKTFLNGLFDGSDIIVPGVTGASVEALVIFIDTGTAATSRLISYVDTGVTGLPVTPNGGDINVVWNAAGIIQL